jgi:cation:H+ antiporter
MLVVCISFVLGLIILAVGAERFVAGASAIARHCNMPIFLVGMIIVGFGTSAPELAISAFASIQEKSDIALGNAYGSNIANIGLIIGITAVIRPIVIKSKFLKKELLLLAVATLIGIYQLLDKSVSRLDGALLLSLFAFIMGWLVSQKKTRDDPIEYEYKNHLSQSIPPIKSASMWTGIGIAALVIGSQIMIWSAVEIAKFFHVSELIISLTIIAIGTSLPELASTIAASLKEEDDLVLGNVVGSNLFNTLAVVGIAALIHPIPVDQDFVVRDCSIMSLLTASLFICGPGKISRIEGAVLITIYFGYLVYLIKSPLW